MAEHILNVSEHSINISEHFLNVSEHLYMQSLAFQFVFSAFVGCCFSDQKRIEAARKQGDAELIRRVLSANFCVDERGEPRSAPLLLGYEPQVKSFLEGPTVPRSEAFEILPRAPFVAQPTESKQLEESPDRIPTGQVYAMAPPINPFKVMGKPATVVPSRKAKDKGKGKRKSPEAPKIPERHPEEISITETASQHTPEQEPVSEPAKVHTVEEPEREEERQPRQKRGRTEPPTISVEGPSSYALAWDPALLFGQHPISVQDTIMDNPDSDVSGQIARGLAFAACLPEDMKRWAGIQPGPAFRQITKNLMLVSAPEPLVCFIYIYICYLLNELSFPKLLNFFSPLLYTFPYCLGHSGCHDHGSEVLQTVREAPEE